MRANGADADARVQWLGGGRADPPKHGPTQGRKKEKKIKKEKEKKNNGPTTVSKVTGKKQKKKTTVLFLRQVFERVGR